MARFKRILLKLSGESLMGKQNYGIDAERLDDYARQIREVHEMGAALKMCTGKIPIESAYPKNIPASKAVPDSFSYNTVRSHSQTMYKQKFLLI